MSVADPRDIPEITFRPARSGDLSLLVKMLADDNLGATRENWSKPLDSRYLAAFEEIETDPNNELVVVEHQGQVIGMLQITFIPYLTYTGSWRCLVEGVRVHPQWRGRGIGRRLFQWAIERARNRGCALVQLTSDKQRTSALRFYESLGFVASHEGFKLRLSPGPNS